MAHTSSAVKARYNKKAYDQIAIRVPKGWKDHVKQAAEAEGESLANFIRTAVDARIASSVNHPA